MTTSIWKKKTASWDWTTFYILDEWKEKANEDGSLKSIEVNMVFKSILNEW